LLSKNARSIFLSAWIFINALPRHKMPTIYHMTSDYLAGRSEEYALPAQPPAKPQWSASDCFLAGHIYKVL